MPSACAAAFAVPAAVGTRAGLFTRPRSPSARPRALPHAATRRRAAAPPRAATASPNDGEKGEDAKPSAIDWDSDWSNFRSAGMVSEAGPGRSPPTPQERAARKAAEQVRSVRNSLPSRQALFADWRFWAAVLLSLSVFTAVVGNSQASAPVVGGTL